MKKLISLLAVLVLALAPVAFATYDNECSPNGCSQGTLVRALYNHQVGLNDVIANTLNGDLLTEIKTDMNANNDEFGLAVSELTELKVDHDADNNVVAVYKANLDLIKNAGIIQTHGALLGAPAVAIGGTNTKARTTNPISYTVDGAYYYKAATDDVCDATGVPALTTDYKKIMFSIGAAGTCTVTASAGAVDLASVVLPVVPDNEIVIGGLTIGNGAAHDFAAAALTANGGTFVGPDYFTVPKMATMAATAADLAAANPTGFAADLAEAVATGTVVGATSYGTGTDADPLVKIVD
jgi:hypothetical protein